MFQESCKNAKRQPENPVSRDILQNERRALKTVIRRKKCQAIAILSSWLSKLGTHENFGGKFPSN